MARYSKAARNLNYWPADSSKEKCYRNLCASILFHAVLGVKRGCQADALFLKCSKSDLYFQYLDLNKAACLESLDLI